MNEDDNMSVYIGGAAGTDTITIAADDLSTINLGDITLNTTPTKNSSWASFNSIFESLGGKDPDKKSTVYDLDIDPFAAIIELKAEGRFPEIELIKRHIPSKETNEYAQTIREYFLDRIVTQKLSSTYRDSDFKRDMVKALKLSGKQVLEDDHIRLLYRLPDFYQEDIFKDALVEKNKSFLDYKGKTKIDNVELTYIGSIDYYRRGHRAKEFYFKNCDGFVFVLNSVQSANLLPLTTIFNQIKSLTVTGTINYNKLKGHELIVATFNNKYTVEEFNF
jgi:hypothetical protein